jgi:HK97 family phage portal protein
VAFWRRSEPVEEWRCLAEARSLSKESLPPVLAPPIAAAEAINARSALGLADVYACCRALSDAAALCELRCWRDTEEGRVTLTGGRGPGLLRNPAPGVTQPALVASLVQAHCTWGESFCGKVRDADGQVVQLESLDPARMVVRLDKGQPVYDYYSPLDGAFMGLGVQDVIHTYAMKSPDGLRGASPIGLCKEALGLAASLNTAAAATWANGAVPAGVLSIGGAAPGANVQDQIQALKDAWEARHLGAEARGRVAVIRGDIQWQSISMPLSDAEFIAQQRLSTATIARIFRVPVSVIGGSTGDSVTYRNAVGEAELLVKFGLAPILRLLEAAIGGDSDLLPGDSTGCSFDVDRVLLRADPSTRAAINIQYLAAGVISVEEVREREGFGPMPPGHTVVPDPALVQSAQKLAMGGLTRGETSGG